LTVTNADLNYVDSGVNSNEALTDEVTGAAFNGQSLANSNIAYANTGSKQYFDLDLGGLYSVDSLTLWGRNDGAADESQNLRIFTGATAFGASTYATLSASAVVKKFDVATVDKTINGPGTSVTGISSNTSDDTTPTLNGTLSQAIGGTDVVNIYDNGTFVGTATLNGPRTAWTYTPTALTDNTAHNYTARVADSNSATGSVSNTLTLTICVATPLVLDLNGDGVHTVGAAQGVLFDVANNGTLSQTGWTNANDGLLVRDINHDGLINNGAELFGNGTLLADGSQAANGFAALAQFDANLDGKIDAQDAVFGTLKVWRDANGDGVSQAHELLSMADTGIESFNLSSSHGSVMENGNTLDLVSSYTTTDGRVHDLADVWFQQGAQFTLDTDAAGLNYLHLGTSGQALDLTSVDTSRLQGINLIDLLSNQVSDTLTLGLQQVVNLGVMNQVNSGTAGLTGSSYHFDATESHHQLLVNGSAADTLIIVGGFVDTGLCATLNGHTYEVYNQGRDAQLLVEQAMNRTLIA
jgi:hypothetical protein